MDPMRVLVVYFTRTGTTRVVARAICKELGCEMEAITERKSRSGVVGYVRSAIDATFHRAAELHPMSSDPKDYDLVVIGTPVWSASVSAPVRTYLEKNRDRLSRVAFFCTYGGSGSARALRQMEEICGQAPTITLAVRMDEVSHEGLSAKVRSFATALHTGAPAPNSNRPPSLHVVHA